MARIEEANNVFNHPFSDSIMSTPLPNGFQHPKIEQYDGSSDPDDHLAMFNAYMLLYGDTVTDPIKCRVFPSTLTSYALRWFFTLPPLSINTFSEFSTKFLTHFVLSKTHRKNSMTITCLKQRPDESLKDYVNRFNQEAIQIDNLNPKLLMYLIEAGLKPGPFADSLAKKPPVNLDDFRRRATGYIKMEEQQAPDCNKRQWERDDHSCNEEKKRRRFYSKGSDEIESVRKELYDDEYYTEIDDPIPMVISVENMNFVVYRVSMDPQSSVNILYWPAFLKMELSESMLRPFEGALEGLTGEVKGYVELDTTFGEGDDGDERTIKVKYLVIDSSSTYSVVIGRPTLNALGAKVLTPFPTIKYTARN